MLTIFLALAAGLVGGAVAGSVVAWRLLRYARSAPSDHESISPDVNDRIGQAAAQWATARGQPAATPLVADKLRLAYVLSQRRTRRRRRRRWSR